jgi:hypothetical protein
VFRAAALSVVLTVAVGPSASLLCKAWCHPQAGATTECHHADPTASPSVAGDDHCDNVVLGATAVLPEEGRRGVSVPGADHATPVTRYQPAPPTTDTNPRHEPWREWSLEKRPLSTALRI